MNNFNVNHTLLINIRNAVGRKVILHMFIDSKQVFDFVTCEKRPTEQCLATDVSETHEAYTKREINYVNIVRGRDNPAYWLSKAGANEILESLLEMGVNITPVQEWIFRKDNDTYAKESGCSVDCRLRYLALPA